MELPDTAARTILLVEDEDALRRLNLRVLQRAGHTVLEARTAPDALSVAADHDGRIDLLVTDIVLPRMSGAQLAEQMAAGNPGLAVLYVSGYGPDTMDRHGVAQDDVAFLQKPFRPGDLVAAVDDALAA